MKRSITRILGRILPLFIACQCTLTAAHAGDGSGNYGKERPVVIVCDWDYPPFEFSNDYGRPDGFNVQLLGTILRQAGIPCQFVMKEWYQAQEMFENREADLMIDTQAKYMKPPYVHSRNIINYYRAKIATARDAAIVDRLSMLNGSDTLVLKKNDYSAERIINERHLDIPVEYHTAKEAIQGIASGKYKHFIWGEYPLKWKMKTLAIDSIYLGDIDIPDGEMRIVGYDKALVDFIDDEYTRLEQSGELVTIRDTWFHPERIHNDTSPVALIVLAVIIIAAVFAFLMSRLIRVRVRIAVRKSNDINNMMNQAVNMGDLKVVEYDLQTGLTRNLYGSLLPADGVAFADFVSHIHPDEQEQFKQETQLIAKGTEQRHKLMVRWNGGTADSPQWAYLHGSACAETERGQQRYIIYSLQDITHEVEETMLNEELGTKYMKVFDTNLLALSFYSRNGRLIDLNEKMRQLCGFDAEGERFFRSTSMFDIPLFMNDFDRTTHDHFHVCQRMHYPEIGIDKYIEFRVCPTFDENDRLAYYIVIARDITAERDMYLEQRSHDEQLQQTNKTINEYEQQLRYLLEKSNMYVWHSDIATRTIYYSRSLRDMDITESIEEYIASIHEDEREDAKKMILDKDYEERSFNVVHHFLRTPISKKPSWLSISGMPIHDDKGNYKGHFGVVRDITKLMNIQQQLKEETARAEDSGRLKSAFLANMTHEIRTPLNAIVGFSDLLPLIDSQEERMEFIRIIRNNCDMLIRLINDILEASTMGQALAIEPKECDLAQVFDDICQTLAQRVEEPGVEFIKDNPSDHYTVTIDKGRLQQVLTNFVTNAVKYTHQGHIRVGYRKEERNGSDGTFFYCEDTGAGIPKEKQAAVFDRFVKLNDFVQGTGLGLSICKSIAERCGGQIGVTSEGEGHGSTFWIWIPKSEK